MSAVFDEENDCGGCRCPKKSCPHSDDCKWGREPEKPEVCTEPCCTACGGAGANLSGPCSDCYDTGHPHEMGTRYDTWPSSDGMGGPHPLAGVPQSALDAVVRALDDACYAHVSGLRAFEREDLEPI